jgi:hypothetical protein
MGSGNWPLVPYYLSLGAFFLNPLSLIPFSGLIPHCLKVVVDLNRLARTDHNFPAR